MRRHDGLEVDDNILGEVVVSPGYFYGLSEVVADSGLNQVTRYPCKISTDCRKVSMRAPISTIFGAQQSGTYR